MIARVRTNFIKYFLSMIIIFIKTISFFEFIPFYQFTSFYLINLFDLFHLFYQFILFYQFNIYIFHFINLIFTYFILSIWYLHIPFYQFDIYNFYTQLMIPHFPIVIKNIIFNYRHIVDHQKEMDMMPSHPGVST